MNQKSIKIFHGCVIRALRNNCALNFFENASRLLFANETFIGTYCITYAYNEPGIIKMIYSRIIYASELLIIVTDILPFSMSGKVSFNILPTGCDGTRDAFHFPPAASASSSKIRDKSAFGIRRRRRVNVARAAIDWQNSASLRIVNLKSGR